MGDRRLWFPVLSALSRERCRAVLLVADFFQPIHRPVVLRFGKGDVRHRAVRRDAVPVFDAGWNLHHVARPHLFNRAAPALHAPDARSHDQGLSQRVRVPGGASARLKGDGSAA